MGVRDGLDADVRRLLELSMGLMPAQWHELAGEYADHREYAECVDLLRASLLQTNSALDSEGSRLLAELVATLRLGDAVTSFEWAVSSERRNIHDEQS